MEWSSRWPLTTTIERKSDKSDRFFPSADRNRTLDPAADLLMVQRISAGYSKAQQSAGTIKMKPLLDRVIKELTSAGLLRDPNSDHGGAGRSICLSCNRPMSVGADSGNTR